MGCLMWPPRGHLWALLPAPPTRPTASRIAALGAGYGESPCRVKAPQTQTPPPGCPTAVRGCACDGELAASLREVLGDGVPVDGVPPGTQVVRTLVLVLQVVG